MPAPSKQQAIELWANRLAGLESALAQSGRSGLHDTLDGVRQLVGVMAQAGPGESELLTLLGRALADIKACVLDEARRPDQELVAAMQAYATPSIALCPPQSASVPSEVDDIDDSWANGMLDAFASAEDDDIDAIVAELADDQSRARPRPTDELGTLSEPLNRGANARVLMKGEIQPGLLSDIIQLFAQNTETGRLLVESPFLNASIFFLDGRIVDAECGELVGERGFFEAMQIEEGRFSYHRGVVCDEERIFRSAQHLIMDTLRMIDEGAQ